MSENFDFKPDFFHFTNIFCRAFAREHDARKAQLFRHFRALGVMDTHLSGRMKGDFAPCENFERAEIGDDKGVRARVGGSRHISFERRQFRVFDAGVKSNIDLYPEKVAKVYMLFDIFYGKVFRFRARVEEIEPEIDRVGAVIDRRFQRFDIPRGRKQFHQRKTAPSFSFRRASSFSMRCAISSSVSVRSSARKTMPTATLFLPLPTASLR